MPQDAGLDQLHETTEATEVLRVLRESLRDASFGVAVAWVLSTAPGEKPSRGELLNGIE
jgi:hypothetical protein